MCTVNKVLQELVGLHELAVHSTIMLESSKTGYLVVLSSSAENCGISVWLGH